MNEEEMLNQFPEKYALLMDVFVNCIWGPDLFEKYPKLNRIYEMFALATLPECRGRGIAKKMVLASWQV